jgi:hypothetical protein
MYSYTVGIQREFRSFLRNPRLNLCPVIVVTCLRSPPKAAGATLLSILKRLPDSISLYISLKRQRVHCAPIAVAVAWDVARPTAPVLRLNSFRAGLSTLNCSNGLILALACEATCAHAKLDSYLRTGDPGHHFVNSPCVGASTLTLASLFLSRTGQVE